MKILAVDIGTGTQDIYLFDSRLSIENGYRLVLPSPTMMVRRKLRDAASEGRDVLLSGVTMGGGPSTMAVRAHLKAGLRVFATPDAAKTLDDHLDNVTSMGVTLVSDDEGSRLNGRVTRVEMQDFDFNLLRQTFARFGVSLDTLDALAIAVFDHGAAPVDVSDRKFRFEYLGERVKQQNRLSAFAYRRTDIPQIMTRFQAVAESTRNLPFPLVVMDTAPAAVLGALCDPRAAKPARKMIINIGNAHTLAFRLDGERIEAIFEHHTGCLNRKTLESLLTRLAENTLDGEEVYASDGHGALLCTQERFDLSAPGAEIVITGPRRALMQGSSLPHYFAAPYGDMMLSGCYGLLSATADLYPEYSAEIRCALENRLENSPQPWSLD